ncbi:Bacterial dynamin-like protein [compost metagenome]
MKELIRTYQEIASYLGEESSFHLLEGLVGRQQSGQFYLPVIGQYSAGKSRFINTLMGMNYLPTKGTETTAYPTFISYGGEDQAFIERMNGSILAIAPEELGSYQHTEDGMEAGEIRALHLKLKNPLFAQGLVLVDTPGFNTLVRSHEEVTLSVIPQAQFLIYVMGKALTDYDVRLLRKVEEMGIELIFVRTKLDEIKQSEESLEDLLLLENRRIQSHFERKRPFFAVSSEQEALEHPEWQQRIETVRDYISEQMNPRLQEIWSQSLAQRLLILGREFTTMLKEKQDLLRSADTVSVDTLQEQVAYLEQQLKQIEHSHRTNSKQIQNELAPFQLKIMAEAKSLMEPYTEKFRREIALQPSIEAMQLSAQDGAIKQVEGYMQRVQEMFTDYTQHMIEQGFKGHQLHMQEISEQLQSKLKLTVPFKLRLPDASRILQDRQYAVEQLEGELEQLAGLLLQSDDELSEFGLSKEEVVAMAQEANRMVAQARSDAEDYTPQMKWVEGNQNVSEVMGTIGNIADWLTIFIPGKNAATIGNKAVKLTQFAQKLNVSTKTLQAATKTIQTAAKGAELLKKVDKAMDIVNKVKDIQDIARQKIPEGKQSGLLDLVTLEFWFRKAGTMFDTPPRYELDKAAEAVYHNRKRELEQRHQQAIKKELNQLEELRLLRTQEERVKRERELQLRNQKSLERQLVAEQAKANMEAAAIYTQQLVKLFEEELSQAHAQLQGELDRLYRYHVQSIIISATVESKERMESMQDSLQRLIDEKQNRTDNQDQAIHQVEAYLQWLTNATIRLESGAVCIQ